MGPKHGAALENPGERGGSAPGKLLSIPHQQLPASRRSRPHSTSLPCSSANTHCRCLCLFSRKIRRPCAGTLLARSRWRKYLSSPRATHPGASFKGEGKMRQPRSALFPWGKSLPAAAKTSSSRDIIKTQVSRFLSSRWHRGASVVQTQ